MTSECPQESTGKRERKRERLTCERALKVSSLALYSHTLILNTRSPSIHVLSLSLSFIGPGSLLLALSPITLSFFLSLTCSLSLVYPYKEPQGSLISMHLYAFPSQHLSHLCFALLDAVSGEEDDHHHHDPTTRISRDRAWSE